MPLDNPEQPSGSGPNQGEPPDELSQHNTSPASLDYEVVRLIARGGYGEVWLVRDRAGAYRACKVVYRESFADERPYEREYTGIKNFEPISKSNESQVQILHLGRRDEAGYFYYIMELADDVNHGREIDAERYVPKTLKSEMERRGVLPVSECVHIGLALSAALENLHRNGLIHRDVKPANIIFVNGLPKLADIGLLTEADVSISYVGTEGYIPPEGPTSPQADVYGLGKVLYEISTGRDRQDFPALGADFTELSDRPTRLELNAVVMRACQSDRRKRYQSAREVHTDLALLQSGGSVRRRRLVRQRLAWGARLGLALAAILIMIASPGLRTHLWRTNRGSPKAKVVAPRIPVSDGATIRGAETEIRRSYRDELADGRPEAKARIVRDLLTRSAITQDPARELAALRVAAALAIEVQDFTTALEACRKMGERFQIETLTAKVELLVSGSRQDLSAANKTRLAEACIATGFEALAQDNYEEGAILAELGRSAVRQSTNPDLAKQAEWLDAELTRCRRAYAPVKKFVELLLQEPANPEANLRVGEFRCFTKNEWETGLAMIAHGNDDGLRAVLERELGQTALDSPQQVIMGDLWWARAAVATGQSQLDFQRRARFWYLKGMAQAKGAEKERLRDQLAGRINKTPAAVGEVHIFSRVNGAEHIALFTDEVRWVSTRGSLNNRINHVLVGEIQRNGSKVIKNCGATRLFPEDIDFRTARLTINHKGKKRGRASLEVAEDHVRIDLVDQPIGSSDLEVTVTFGQP